MPWKHHVRIITECKTIAEAIFYIDKTIEGSWSRSFLESEIKDDLFSKQGQSLNNFDSLLSAKEAKAAKEILKSSYTFDFLDIADEHSERELEDALATNIQRFLLELGKGFSFYGRQLELRMPGGQTFYPDLVF